MNRLSILMQMTMFSGGMDRFLGSLSAPRYFCTLSVLVELVSCSFDSLFLQLFPSGVRASHITFSI